VLRVYGIERSRASRVHWCLRELGLEFEAVPVSFMDGGTRAPDYLAVNPNGRIPAIDDDGFVLWESLAINLYLVKRHGGPLAPRDLREDAQMMQWSLWAANELERDLILVMANRVVFREQDRDRDQESAAAERLDRPLAALESVLAEREWLVDDRFTVADLNVATILSLARLGEMPLSTAPRVDAWLNRCLARPACRYEMQRLPRGLPRPPQMARPGAGTPP
jgi:glutathione S-transferase